MGLTNGYLNGVKPSFRYTVIDDRLCRLEGVRGLKSLKNSEIVFFFKGGEVAVVGENLRVTCIYCGDAIIEGKIVSVGRGIKV